MWNQSAIIRRPGGENKDGSMLITDDGASKIWRVSYEGVGSPKK